MLTPEEKIQLFSSLFHGRDDVFAKRWEKADGSRSGYSPVCVNEWKEGVCVKTQKKKCTNCVYPKLNEGYIRKHLEGKMVLGVYPLLPDNKSYFLVADFDEATWRKDAVAFFEQCVHYDIPAYVERSRSGNGAHVWWFFSTPCTAALSRELGFQLLQLAGLAEDFVPLDSFDRFIPNQDYLRKEAIGNLVALPLQWQARQQNNSVFVDPNNNFEAYSDQWKFLQTIQTIEPQQIEQILERIETVKQESKPKHKDKKLHIALGTHLSISAVQIPASLKQFLTEQLNFINAEYLVKKKMHASVYGVEKYFHLIEKENGIVRIPRGFLSALKQFCEEHLISYVIEDKRHRCDAVEFSSTYTLRPYQIVAVEEMVAAEGGILVSPWIWKNSDGTQYNAEIKKYQNRLEQVYIDKLDSSITQEQYDKLSSQFRAKQTEYRSKLEQLQKADESYYIDAIAILNIASRSKELFIGSELDQKREIIQLVLQNLSFDGQKVQFSLQKPFDSIFLAHNHSAWGRIVDEVRTGLQQANNLYGLSLDI